MAIDFGELLADEVVAYLRDEMPDKMNAIQQGKADDLQLPAPREYHIADPLERINIGVDTPRLHVVVPNAQITNWSASFVMQTQQLWIWLIVADVTAENLFRRRVRYMRGIWELLVAGTAAGSISGHLDASAEGQAARPLIDYGETLTRGAETRADARMLVTFARKDDA